MALFFTLLQMWRVRRFKLYLAAFFDSVAMELAPLAQGIQAVKM
jgi:hypothetical protein